MIDEETNELLNQLHDQNVDREKEKRDLYKLMGDINLIQKNAYDSDAIMEFASKLTSESARSSLILAILKKLTEVKNDFVAHVHMNDERIKKVNQELSESNIRSKEANEKLESFILAGASLERQLFQMAQLIKSGNISKETVAKLAVITKTYRSVCNKCNEEHVSAIGWLKENRTCKKCKSRYEVFVDYA